MPFHNSETLKYTGIFIITLIGGAGIYFVLTNTLGAPETTYSAETVTSNTNKIITHQLTAQLLFAATFAWITTFCVWLCERSIKIFK